MMIMLIPSKLYLASEVLLYPLLACAKCATAMLVVLIQTLSLIWVFWVICGLVIAWAIASACVIASQCSPTPWAMGPSDGVSCINQHTAQVAIKITDILTDIALAVIPGVLFMRLKMSRSKRLVVAFLFGLRIMYDSHSLDSQSCIRSADNVQNAHIHAVVDARTPRLLQCAYARSTLSICPSVAVELTCCRPVPSYGLHSFHPTLHRRLGSGCVQRSHGGHRHCVERVQHLEVFADQIDHFEARPFSE